VPTLANGVAVERWSVFSEQPWGNSPERQGLAGKGKPMPKVCAAIARELVGFIWAIAQTYPRPEASAK